jgi:flagellar hook-basal body complex protein FliE
MTAPISPVTLANPATAIQAAPAVSGESNEGNVFHSMFKTAVNTVENFQAQANQSVENFLAGKNEDVHTAVLATQRADLSFELFMQVRNKVVSACQEIMRMQV